jgi:hypothetical protein
MMVWMLGALFALRINGAAAALAWSTAAPVCILVGIATFIAIAQRLSMDSKKLTQAIMAFPAVRIVAAAAFGWLVVGFLPTESQESYWVCLVVAYVVTLAIETVLLAKLVRGNPNPAQVQGAA